MVHFHCAKRTLKGVSQGQEILPAKSPTIAQSPQLLYSLSPIAKKKARALIIDWHVLGIFKLNVRTIPISCAIIPQRLQH